MIDRFFSVYISVSPSPGEPRVETLLPTLLRLGIFPVWPERCDDWGARKALLDSSDYLMLFSGRSYVARPPTGVSWQHQELNYANVRQIPVFSALLDAAQLDDQAEGRFSARLQAFRSQLDSHMVWSERRTIPAQLKKLWPGFVQNHPVAGWAREGVSVPSPTVSAPVTGKEPVDSIVDVESQDAATWLDAAESFNFSCNIYKGGNCVVVEQSGLMSWFEICEAFLAPMAPSASEDRIEKVLSERLAERFTQQVLAAHNQAHAATEFCFSETSMRKIRLKLRRSGLIRKDTKASGRHHQVWVVTEDGQQLAKTFGEKHAPVC